MNIVIEYDSSVDAAPAGFKIAVDAAVAYFDSLITSPITVAIMFSYGSLDGQALKSNALGESSTNGNIETYASVKSLLTASATSSADSQSIANLPSTDPTNGALFWVSDAEANAFGLGSQPGFNDPEVGFVALGSGDNFTYDPNNRAVSGAYDAIGVLEHEISEALGRVSYLGASTANGFYSPLDLFRYASPGVRDLTNTAGYFSVDGQNMLMAYNDPSNGGDAGDWNSTGSTDAFDASTPPGVEGTISAADLLEIDLLGFSINPAATQDMTTTYVSAGVTSSSLTVSSPQALSVLSGGVAIGTVVLNGSDEFLFSGGVASSSGSLQRPGSGFRAAVWPAARCSGERATGLRVGRDGDRDQH